jgi:hypothetical protein
MAVELRTLAAAAAEACALAVEVEACAPVAAEACTWAAAVFVPAAAVAPVSARDRRYRVPTLVRFLVAMSRARLFAMPAADPRPLPPRQEQQGSM